ncbi:hypothetical protein C8Q79DRAFT_636635 [Trametes meyenii]|nr:hypothetical protein C8Q79DRAFT_636635 [Trametes meyenii]
MKGTFVRSFPGFIIQLVSPGLVEARWTSIMISCPWDPRQSDKRNGRPLQAHNRKTLVSLGIKQRCISRNVRRRQVTDIVDSMNINYTTTPECI